MRSRLLGALAVWTVGGGLALAQRALPVDVPGILPEETAPAPAERLPAAPVLRDLAVPARPAVRTLQPLPQTAEAIPPAPLAPLGPPPAGTPVPVVAPVAAGDAAVGPTTTLLGGQPTPMYLGRYVYASAEYLLFELRRGPAPPLAQVIPPELANMGDLPPEAATTIFGAEGIDPNPFNGVRGTVGVWLNRCQSAALEVSYFQLAEERVGFAIQSLGQPVIGRGFQDVSAGRTSFLQYTSPDGTQTGFIGVDAPMSFWGTEANVRWKGSAVLADHLEWIAGIRYADLRESLDIVSSSTFTAPPPLTLTSFENFSTTNQFYGTQTGLESHFRYRSWQLDLGAKLASGWVHQEARIAGGTRREQPGTPTVDFPNQSILYVQRTNAGEYSRNRAAILTDLMARLGFQVTPNIRATVGWNLIAISSVQRPGAAIDEGVNPANTQFINVRNAVDAPRPTFIFRGTDFWAHGLTLGVSVVY